MESFNRNAVETYNTIANWFAENRLQELIEKPYLDRVINIVGPGANVLDLGCGTGMPVMKYLLENGMNVVGVDASERILEIAKRNFPAVHFLPADMRRLSLDKKFHAIIAWNSFFHLPSEDQPAMFNIIKEHLSENGVFLFTSGKEWGEAWGVNGGENLFHASLNTDQYQLLLQQYQMRVLLYNENDPECENATVWLAQLVN
jgi:2-polyprenyl-3-methyl-5-hydroxy-6-metoxy-1,4-benzoquinol methylase